MSFAITFYIRCRTWQVTTKVFTHIPVFSSNHIHTHILKVMVVALTRYLVQLEYISPIIISISAIINLTLNIVQDI